MLILLYDLLGGASHDDVELNLISKGDVVENDIVFVGHGDDFE